ncbi:MAG: sugar transferase, partial [Clostridiaceae bacterium]|nr:sugar transferase [Clostridiaceae bacterium]
MYEKYFKRIFDLVFSLLLLIIFLPLFLIIAILVKIKLGSPVIFVQKRIGKYEKLFNHIKFRSMTNEKDEHGVLLPNEKRPTRFGALLRSTSLDELPQLLNIIVGEMSIIGPRPM